MDKKPREKANEFTFSSGAKIKFGPVIEVEETINMTLYLNREELLAILEEWEMITVPLDKATIDEIFTYHAPQGTQPTQYAAIREAAKQFANVIIDNTPRCADQTVAIRLLREAVMTANAAIALNGLV